MIALTSEQDKAQLKEHALELLKKGNFEGLVILVEALNDTDFEFKGTDFEIKGTHYYFNCALLQAKLDIAKVIKQKDSNVYPHGDTLVYAIAEGHLECVSYLLSDPNNVYRLNKCYSSTQTIYPLRADSEDRRIAIFSVLLQYGVDIRNNGTNMLQIAASLGHLKTLKYLVESGLSFSDKGESCLRAAEKYGHTEVVEYLEGVLKNDSNRK